MSTHVHVHGKVSGSKPWRVAAALLVLSLAVACKREDDSGSSDDTDTSDDDDTADTADTDTADTDPTDTDPTDTDTSDTDTGGPTVPRVIANTPLSGATSVNFNANASATFSEDMDASTLTETTFTVTFGDPAVALDGTVVYGAAKAVFWPDAPLEKNTTFTATITTGAESVSGVPMAASHRWLFATGDEIVPGLPVHLGTAGDFAVLSKSGISSVPASAITGDIGVSPVTATAITGFSLTADSSGTFSTSTQVTGDVYAANYTTPTPSRLTTAVLDMQLAFTDAAGRAADVSELGAGDIGGLTLAPGVYKWGSGLLIPDDVTLAGSDTDVWIFQVAQNLTVHSGTSVFLAGAVPENVFWQVSGLVEMGTTAHLEGIVLSQTGITLATDASVDGRLLAQTAVTLDQSTVAEPD